MKLIIAYIQPDKIDEVKTALVSAGIGRWSVTNALGCGSQHGYSESYRGVDVEINLLKKIRIEIAVNDEFEQIAVDAIVDAARCEQIGDGKIFVIQLERCVRIRTLEEGGVAVG